MSDSAPDPAPAPEIAEAAPPHSLDIERAILGAMMMAEQAADQALGRTSADMWYSNAHRHIYEAIAALRAQGQTADMLTVTERLRSSGNLDDAGGMVYVARLSTETATWRNIGAHVSILADKYAQRELIRIGGDIASMAQSQERGASEIAEDAHTRLMRLYTAAQHIGLVHIARVADAVMERLQAVAEADGATTGIPSGIADLDDRTGGFQRGEMIVLAARPAMGKTALALQFARAGAEHGNGAVAVFSLEMSAESLMQRMISQQTGVSTYRMRTGQMGPTEWEQVAIATSALARLPLHIDDQSYTVAQIAGQCARIRIHDRGIALVVVDYLQLMEGTRTRTGSREQEVSSISRGLKLLAKDLEAPVIALSQLSRGVEARNDHRPRLSDLRESGSIEQDADVVMFLRRPEEYGIREVDMHGTGEKISSEGLAELDVAKQRNGPTGSMWLRWDGASTHFTALDTHHDEDPGRHFGGREP